MSPKQPPRHIHVVTDGDQLHLLVVERLHRNHGVSMSISATAPPTARAGSRIKNWARRQHDLDGVPGLLREASNNLKPGLRVISTKARARRASTDQATSDEHFIALFSLGDAPSPIEAPEKVQTLVVLGQLQCDIEAEQRFDVHFAWPPHRSRDGVVAALTHRNLDALCTVVVASGNYSGTAVARPPLCVSDDPTRIHQRLVALGASMVDEVINDPEANLEPTPPPPAMTNSIADSDAVRRDFSSGRMAEVIRSMTRF